MNPNKVSSWILQLFHICGILQDDTVNDRRSAGESKSALVTLV